MTEIEAYIRAAAIARNINPDVAVQIAMTEGGVTDPYRQSEVIGPGGREQSYGPFQLYMNGGLGDQALKMGIDPRNDYKRGIDFALDVAAKKKSWADWHGARDNGISDSAGFSETTKPIGITLTSTNSNPSSVISNTVQVPDMVASSAPAPVTPAPVTPAAEEPKGWADKLKSIAEGDDAKALVDNISGKGVSGADPKARSSGSDSIPSILPSLEASDMARMQSAQAMMAQLLMSKKRPRGLSLTGVPT